MWKGTDDSHMLSFGALHFLMHPFFEIPDGLEEAKPVCLLEIFIR